MNNSANYQEQNNPFYTDSDDECAVEKDDCGSPPCVDGMYMSVNSSVTSSALSGPVIPPCMLKGTSMIKVGKKKNTKRITLTYDPMTVRIFWGKDWPSSSKAIYIDDIREIRTADDVAQYRLDSGLDESMSPRFFSILYTRRGQAATKTLHVLADDEAMLSTWTTTLEGVCKSRQAYAMSLMAFDDKALKKWWQIETAKLAGDDKSRGPGEAKVDTVAVDHVCRSLHIHLPLDKLRETIEAVKGPKVGPVGPDKLDFAEFLEFVNLLKTRKDVRPLYNQIAANPGRGITKDEFFRFLRDVQREDVNGEVEKWESVFARFARKKKLKDAEKSLDGAEDDLTISEGGLVAFLGSVYNTALAEQPLKYELNRPMNEYYISSSHNTYLLGWQVGGSSSHDGYITALQHGCRCVEIDCWDGPNDEPLVMHGRSWTTSISFREVIKTVNKYAFVKTRFPLWISLEVRCGLATQVNMAKIMIEIFGKKLVREPLHKNSDRLPAPSELLDRILIKVKEAQPLDEPVKSTGDRITRRRGNSQPSPYQRPLPLESVPVPSSPLLSPTPFSRSTRHVNRPNTITEGRVHHSEAESDSERDSTIRKYSSKIHPMLGELGVYCVGIQFDGFDSPSAKRFNHIFSFKEKTFDEKSQPGEQKRKLYLHNMRYMMRVYPNGGRINSSNFDPLIYWKRGVQMAALNWQTFDTGMQLNRAMFDGGTDQSGYVLKPIEGREFGVRHESLKVLNPDEGREFKSRLEPRDMHSSKPRKRARFTIRVISAQQLMKPFTLGPRRAMDPYVEVEVLLADDKRNKAADPTSVGPAPEAHKRRTRIECGNGFNPIFEDVLDFDISTKYSDLIFVRFSVKLADKTYNDRAAPMATFTAKLSSLNQGYRTIPLHNPYGERFSFSTLFCHIEKAPLEDIPFGFIEEAPKNGGKLNRFGRTVFPSSSTSPKTSIDSNRSS